MVRERFVLRIPLDCAERLNGLGLGFRRMRLNHVVRHRAGITTAGKEASFLNDAGVQLYCCKIAS